jgi:LysM repeat protein
MTKYPKIIVVSASYTDARGKSSYNELLSQRRAKSAVNHIFSRGISSDRIYGKGYGESNLTNQCIDNDSHSNSIKCSEAQHQENRRTSFIVLNIGGTKISSEGEKGLSASERDSHMEKPESIYKTHLVGEGETLYFISKKYNLSLGLLKQINTLTGNNVYVNQLLIIDPGPNTGKNINKVLHTVKALETLYAIGQQYNILVERLKSLNGLTNNVISIGQVLRIK